MIVDVEVRVEDGFSLCSKKLWLRLYPFAGLLLLGASEQARFEVANDRGILLGNIRRFARVPPFSFSNLLTISRTR